MFLKHNKLGILESKFLSHSGMAKKDKKNVLKKPFLSYSGMPGNQMFQNTQFWHILEPLLMPISGMANIFAFQNIRHQVFTECIGFLNYKLLGVLEPLLISHSGMPKRRGIQDKNNSENDIFQPFWKA